MALLTILTAATAEIISYSQLIIILKSVAFIVGGFLINLGWRKYDEIRKNKDKTEDNKELSNKNFINSTNDKLEKLTLTIKDNTNATNTLNSTLQFLQCELKDIKKTQEEFDKELESQNVRIVKLETENDINKRK